MNLDTCHVSKVHLSGGFHQIYICVCVCSSSSSSTSNKHSVMVYVLYQNEPSRLRIKKRHGIYRFLLNIT
jgi:hypothetical protein